MTTIVYKMSPIDNMLEHINKIKSMAQQLEAIGAKVEKNDVLMVLLCTLQKFYNNLIVALES